MWSIPLNGPTRPQQKYEKTLSEEEKARAARFRFEQHRRRFILSHYALRKILARLIPVAASEIQFVVDSNGKPRLETGQGVDGLTFNLSHSHELAVVAVSRAGEIGVDVEYLHARRNLDGIAARFFSPVEQAAYFSLAEAQRIEGFFNCWTRKEAFIKALGKGLSYPLRQFDVTLVPGDPPVLLRAGDDSGEANKWTLASFKPMPDYVAALALRKTGIQIHYFNEDEGEFE